jgi:hypothetical protein
VTGVRARGRDHFGWSVVELIEAAVRVGEQPAAHAALERLSERTRASGTEWALGVEAGSRALLSDDGAAEALHRESVERLARGPRRHPPRARSCATASGCGARAGGPRPARSAATRTQRTPAAAPSRSPSARAANCSPRARQPAGARTTPATPSRRKRPKSPGWRLTAIPIRRSAHGCTAAPERSSTTCTRCSASSTSRRGRSFDAGFRSAAR